MNYSRRRFIREASLVGGASFAVPAALNNPLLETDPHTVGSPEQPELHVLTPVSSNEVSITDGFWLPKIKVWQKVTIRDCFRKFENDRGGALNNFDKVRDGQRGGHAGPPWYDGLIYEMIRASADFLVIHPDPALEKQVDGYIARIAAAAAKNPNGYLNTYTQLDEPGHEWGLNGGFQLWQHEVYNAGALIDAGIHYYLATGKVTLLQTGVTFANYMCELMGPPPKKNIVPCHPLPEEAMVKLYELFRAEPDLHNKLSVPVHDSAYLALAEFWIEDRGHNVGKPDWDDSHAAEAFVRHQQYGNGRPSWGTYAQDDKPVFQQETINGHAVRATLLCTGIAAAARVNHRKEYMETASRLWNDMVLRRMHITGGVGAYAVEEKFGPDYVLPNDAYLETCAAVGAGFFHRNMNLAFGDARYVDQLERTLYNGALSGVSLKGDTYFYRNPLEADKDRSRWVWNTCPCCPPMFLKLMGAMPGYIYATDADSLYVNLFVGSNASTAVRQTPLTIKQATEYPWNGTVTISVDPARATSFNLMVRIPAWCKGEQLKVNGAVTKADRLRGYARIARTWKKGDVVELSMPMPAETIKANPQVEADSGKVALIRGPLVYCLESADNGNDVRRFGVHTHSEMKCEHVPDLLGGITTIRGKVAVIDAPAWSDSLYASTEDIPAAKLIQFRAIPYYANANRGPVEMAVWLPETA